MIIAINGSPRRNGNTAALLNEALNGAAEAGKQTEMIHLHGMDIKGCQSCFACKLKKGRAETCTVKDDLRGLLEKLESAEGIIFGSPIYYMNVTPELLALEHRWLFSHMLYNKENRWLYGRSVPTAFIYTFGAGEERASEILGAYPFTFVHDCIRSMTGIRPEIIYAANTWQFADYSLYEADQFDMEMKRRTREEDFPSKLAAARNLGRRMASA